MSGSRNTKFEKHAAKIRRKKGGGEEFLPAWGVKLIASFIAALIIGFSLLAGHPTSAVFVTVGSLLIWRFTALARAFKGMPVPAAINKAAALSGSVIFCIIAALVPFHLPVTEAPLTKAQPPTPSFETEHSPAIYTPLYLEPDRSRPAPRYGNDLDKYRADSEVIVEEWHRTTGQRTDENDILYMQSLLNRTKDQPRR